MAQQPHRGNKQGRAQRDESLESLESRGASQGLAAPQGLAALPPGFPARPPGCPATMPGMPAEPWQAHQDLEHRGQHHPDARGSAGPAPRPSWPPPNPAGPPEPAHQALVTLEQGPAQRSFNWYRRQQDLTRRGGGGPPTPQVEFGGPHRDQPRRLLGVLKYSRDPHFRFFELLFLKRIHQLLTRHWHLMQAECDERATALWHEALWLLEIDTKGQTDLFLLAQCGAAGRAEANEILWNLLTNEALDSEYLDLSHLLSNRVREARRYFERPPRDHVDRGTWDWGRYWRVRNPAFSPEEVKRQHPGAPLRHERLHVTSTGGVPLAPPRCWPGDHREL